MRILIVDDEKIIRSAIAEEIQALQLYSAVDTAKNGLEALALLRAHSYDCLILDIMMPRMDGLALLNAAREEQPEQYDRMIKVILSGYDDFSFAQKALRHGVQDFLLKPLLPEDIRQLALRMLEMAKERQGDLLARTAKQSDGPEKESALALLFWKSLLSGENNEEAIADRCAELGLAMEDCFYQVFLLFSKAEKADDAVPTPEHSLERRIKESLAVAACESSIVFPLEEDIFVLVTKTSEKDQQLKMRIVSIMQELACRSAKSICWSMGSPVSRLADLHQSFVEATFLLRYTMAERRLFPQPEGGASPDTLATGSLQIYDLYQLQNWLWLGERAQVEAYLDEAFTKIRRQAELQQPQNLQAFASGMCFICMSILNGVEVDKMNEEYLALYGRLTKAGNSFLLLEDFEAEMRRILFQIMEYCADSVDSGGSALVNQAKAIVMRQYKQDLSSQKLAEQLGVSRNHFGQLFKRNEGMSFTEFLNHVRMDKARELLLTSNMKVYEISEAVGIKDSYYFSQLFKKCYGISPSQCRERCQ